jgi:uncharacterized protein YhjY with autotransporter beta-barrel domain/phospholipase/lecithinase/hemolysin
MKKKSNIFASLLMTSALVCTSVVANAGSKEKFSNVISFGGSFTSPAGTWADVVTQRYGFQFTTNDTNFAVGGAGSLDLAAQLATYQANKKFDPNALYQVYVGPNDLPGIIGGVDNDLLLTPALMGLTYQDLAARFQDGTLSLADLPYTTTEITNRFNAMGNFVQNLSNSGARYIIVFNHLNEAYRDLARITFNALTSQELMSLGSMLENMFNNEVIYKGIDQLAPNANVIYVDYARLVAEISNNPTQYLSATDIAGTYNNMGVFDATAHPTAAAHKITGQYVASIVEAPSRVAYIREMPIITGSAALQNIRDSAYNSVKHSSGKSFAVASGTDSSGESFSVEGGADYIGSKLKSSSNKELGLRKGKIAELYAHIKHRLSEKFQLGLQVNSAKSFMDFKNNNGKADITEYLVTIDATYKFDDPVYVYLAAGAGTIKYDIKRKIPLGLAVRESRGKPSGMHYLATIGTGYNFVTECELAVTPFINVNYQNVSLNSYKETGDLTSTSMSFKFPKRKSLVTEIGATIEKEFAIDDKLTVIPAMTVAAGYDFIDPLKKNAQGKVSDMKRYFSVPTYKIDRSYVAINGQLTASMNKMANYGLRVGTGFGKRSCQYSIGLFGKVSF